MMRLPIEIIENVRNASGFRERHLIKNLCRDFRYHGWPQGKLPPLTEFERLLRPGVIRRSLDPSALSFETVEVRLEVGPPDRTLQRLRALRLDYVPKDYLMAHRRKEIALRRTIWRDGTLKEEVRVTEYRLGADDQWLARPLYRYQRGWKTWWHFKGR